LNTENFRATLQKMILVQFNLFLVNVS